MIGKTIIDNMCRERLRPFPVLFIIIFLFSISLLFAEDPDTILAKFQEQSVNIEFASKVFDIDPFKLKAITYVERKNNYDWHDEYFDYYLAKKGKNSSIGFCQVKMKTAYWIECQLADSTSEFFPGKKYKEILSVSQSPHEIIDKLGDNKTNLLYASAYMRIIQSYWKSKDFSIDDRVDIIATIFSYGMFSRKTGKPLAPNRDPKPNLFGMETLEVYIKFN